MKLEIIKKVLFVLAILAFFRYGVFTFMAVCAFAFGPLGVVINSWPNRKLLNYSMRMQLVDVLPTALVCIAEAVVVFGVDMMFYRMGWSFWQTGSNWSLVAVLLVQFVGGASVFFALSFAFRLVPLGEYVKMMPTSLTRRCPVVYNCLARRFSI